MEFSKEKAIHPEQLWRNTSFNIFWSGQTLSVLGDAFALIALPLLVLQATGSVAQMGLVTGTATVGQIVAGLFAGNIADVVDRRKLMIISDTGRFLLFATLTVSWWLTGPRIWLLYPVACLSSCLGMTFNVSYVTAIPTLVGREQVTEANSRLQITFSLASIVGPILSGIIAARFGPLLAIGIDALSFAFSALSLLFIRLQSTSTVVPETQESSEDASREHSERARNTSILSGRNFVAGVTFLWQQPVLRTVTLFLAVLMFLTYGVFDIFIFHLKHDMGQSSTLIGEIFGIASIGGIIGGLVAPVLRKRLGFGPCWIGAWIVNTVSLLLIVLIPNPLAWSILTMTFVGSQTLAGLTSLSLRQQITPDYLLGRVTSVFWTLHYAPAPLGAALFTWLSAYLGASRVLALIGMIGTLVMLTALLTPARQRFPERRYRNTE